MLINSIYIVYSLNSPTATAVSYSDVKKWFFFFFYWFLLFVFLVLISETINTIATWVYTKYSFSNDETKTVAWKCIFPP